MNVEMVIVIAGDAFGKPFVPPIEMPTKSMFDDWL